MVEVEVEVEVGVEVFPGMQRASQADKRLQSPSLKNPSWFA